MPFSVEVDAKEFGDASLDGPEWVVDACSDLNFSLVSITSVLASDTGLIGSSFTSSTKTQKISFLL